MILFGIPRHVQRFFAPVRSGLSRPIHNALPAMVLALLLAPSRRCLKTLGGAVLGARAAASTISRRLRSTLWRTRNWYVTLYDNIRQQIHQWEQQQQRLHRGRFRRWVIAIDTTYHATHSECMENLLLINRRANPQCRQTRHHAFVMGILITEYGFRLPLPRKSYYTQQYCQQRGRRYRTQVQLAAEMLREVEVPPDVEVVVVYDSAFDANIIHRVCRQRSFDEVFPIDPNRNLSCGDHPDAAGLAGERVVHWTRTWTRDEFTLLELQHTNEDHVFMRRRHCDNLRLRKTFRRYAVAARHANVSQLGECVIVASYKENPSVAVGPEQAADWWSCHTGPVRYDRHRRPRPARWQAKVLACTNVGARGRQVVEWYEIRWQIELYFRELKSRMQFGRYVLKRFEAVERYLDLVMMGLLLLEYERLRESASSEPPDPRGAEPRLQARTTDRLRSLEETCHAWNVDLIAQRIQTEGGRRRLLRELQQVPCHVA
jgi:Transposase DDE domain